MNKISLQNRFYNSMPIQTVQDIYYVDQKGFFKKSFMLFQTYLKRIEK